jgi:SAM-dependent methyltransferase
MHDSRKEYELLQVNLFQNILKDLGSEVNSDALILDFGCGEGWAVYQYRKQGLRAFGVDILNRYESARKLCEDEGLSHANEDVFRTIEMMNYRIPFDDGTFDVVVSDEVFEHVQNYQEALAEIKRVLKPGGSSLHCIPSRYHPIEGHVLVPLATVFQGYAYLAFWAFIGVRNAFQSGLSWKRVATLNYEYLNNCTTYLTKSEISKLVLSGPGMFAAKVQGQDLPLSQVTVMPEGNAIVRENARAGASNWMIPAGKESATEIQAYASATSVSAGQSLTFYVSTQQEGISYAMGIYRLGWYDGWGGRLMAWQGGLSGHVQGSYDPALRKLKNCSSCHVDIATGLVEANGHDEYWTKEMRDGIERARDRGMGLAFLGAGDGYWQMRFEPDSAGVPNRTVNDKNAPDDSNTTYYIASSGAMVFATGSINWTAALDNYQANMSCTPRESPVVPGMQKLMANVMDALIVHHSSL